MKFSFEGTLEEFQSVFAGAGAGAESTARNSEKAERAETEAVQETTPERKEESASLFPSAPIVIPANRWWHAGYSLKEAPRGTPPKSLTMTISDAQREAAWSIFCQFVKLWIEGFEVAGAPQPNRLNAMQELGSGPHVVAILVMAYELRSLQRLIQRALTTLEDPRSADLDFCNRVASHMVTLSNMGYPDIAGTLDFGIGWMKP